MAFAITNVALYPTPQLEALPIPANAATGGPAGASGSTADLTVGSATTTNDATVNLGVACKTFKAIVYMKTVAGTNTIQIKLQVAATDFATIIDLDEKFINVAASTEPLCFTLFGVSPLVAGQQFMRVQFVTGTGTSGTADIVYYAA